MVSLPELKFHEHEIPTASQTSLCILAVHTLTVYSQGTRAQTDIRQVPEQLLPHLVTSLALHRASSIRHVCYHPALVARADVLSIPWNVGYKISLRGSIPRVQLVSDHGAGV